MGPDFERALQKIPPQLRGEEFRFVPILNGRKKPDGKRWNTEANYPYGHAVLAGYLAEGHNYGVLTGMGGLLVLDVDDISRLDAMGIIEKLPETFIVRTGRGGLHFYLLCDLKEKIILEDPELKDSEGDPLHLGELQALGQQVVGPGSIHPNGNRYEVIKNLPIADITKDQLLQILAPLKQISVRKAEEIRTARRRKSGGSSLGDLIPIDQVAMPKGIKERAGSEIQGSHPLHGSTSGKNFSINTSKNCWHCFRHGTGGGPLEWLAVETGLIQCQDAKPECLDTETFKKVLQIARDRGFCILEQESPKVEEPIELDEIEARYKADPDIITTPGALAALRKLSAFKLAGFFKKLRISGDQKKILQSLLKPEPIPAAEDNRFDADILTEANQILDEGWGFEYIYEVWQKRHHGDGNLGKGLLLSIGAQSCISSKGVHIHACGPRGSGKSDGAEKASETIPENYLLVGSASPKALYYLGSRLPAGSVVYLDDIGWNDQSAQMFKTCTTFYREGATHTVVVDQEIGQFKTAPRIIFWLTTADDQTDEQIRDRLLRIDTTEDPKHTKAVIDFIFSQRKSGAASFDPRELKVCQAIIYLLKQVFIDVIIPFTDNIRFEGDPRGATIFADLVSSFAIWRYRIREHDSNGAVIACYEDYKDAETFFNAIRGHGDTKYTPGEMRVLQAIKDLHGEATREMIMEKTGFSKGALADILNGRSRYGQAKYGLLHKCPALSEEDEGTLKRIDEDNKISRRRKVCRLPESYDVMQAYGKTVYLDNETTIKQTCSHGSHGFADSSQGKNKFGKDIVRRI